MDNRRQVVVDVWGKIAMFTPPESKIERVSYCVPTPSACRGVLCSIYLKPIEFYYEIKKIEVMKPIKMIEIKTNESKTKIELKEPHPIYLTMGKMKDPIGMGIRTGQGTQRGNVYLKDVYYRITADIVKRTDAPDRIDIDHLYQQFDKRIKKGKCFRQPFLGTHECMAFFKMPDPYVTPIKESRDFGYMLYDVFDITRNEKLDTSENGNVDKIVSPSFYHAVMRDGTIHVPGWESSDIRRLI
ncbi:type I-C CRISPR-associated protein Cas5c [Bilifractor sp. LCP19S3_H10]|uniref:type I-C CRISPR-associated protein Cas5c n=1 Tax=Bilifractor sp. LCP19S3_H10 TaxID=3438736 RepID=UPI003F8F6A0E